MNRSKILFLLLSLSLISCQNEDNIIAEVYKDNNISTYNGLLYTTKYGGLNYYIPKQQQRESLFKIKNIDSIVFKIGSKKYVAKSLIGKSFSKKRNNSDFSFYTNRKDFKIDIDTIGDLQTLLLISEKTDMELLKQKGIIKSEFIEIK